MLENPVIRGFNADPSFCRVGIDYYVATSTFEWYPGVQIHHSRDLVNWTLVARPLRRASQLDMRGNPDSCGIWAPCLSHADGKFWLVYTDVKRLDGAFKDAHNYIVTCDTIDGDWSDPTYVTSSGFDPSLFHDGDGRKYFVNMRWNHRGKGTGLNPANDLFDGIELQERHPERGLLGEVTTIYTGTSLGLTEAPHLFRRGDYYYLTTAEGGTGYDHAVTLARSFAIRGPYVTHPESHIITARFSPDNPIQRMGHGQYVEGHDGRHWHSYLCGRPQQGPQGLFCVTGRETGLAEMVWRDDWLWLKGGGQLPPTTIDLPASRNPSAHVEHDFSGPTLPTDFQWLRTPHPEARRQEEPAYQAEADFLCDPPNWQRAAGLITYYNRHKFHAALITREAGERVVTLVSCEGDWPGEALTFHGQFPVADGKVTIGVTVDRAVQRFTVNGTAIGPTLDASLVSDEGGRGEHASFTGAFVGVVAHDLTGQGWTADVTRFRYADQI